MRSWKIASCERVIIDSLNCKQKYYLLKIILFCYLKYVANKS